MTDVQLQTLADEYKRLAKLLEQEQNKVNMSMADVNFYEQGMARIEAKFSAADVDISMWI
jgi:hypothetical protein